MIAQSLVVALLASTTLAHAQHGHFHKRRSASGYLPSGSAPSGSVPAPFSNGTVHYFNTTTTSTSTSTSTIKVTEAVTSSSLTTTTVPGVVTVSVVPLPVSEGGSTVAPGLGASTIAAFASSECGASPSTSTVTSTEIFYVTVTAGESSAAAASSAVVSSSSAEYVAPVASTVSSSSSSSSTPSSSAVGSTSYSTSYVTAASSSTPVSVASSSSSISLLDTAVQAAQVTTSSSSTIAASSTVATSSSSVASSASSSASTATSGYKRGLAFNDASLTDMFSGKPVSWAYNWGSAAGGTIGTGLEFVPMLWCPTSMTVDEWDSAVATAVSAGSSHVLSANEPDQSGQCNIPVSEAVTGHQNYMNHHAGTVTIGSPAVTNGGGDMGLTYLENWFTGCAGACHVDFVAIHWYSGYYDGVFDYFKEHVNNATSIAAKNNVAEVWITEFEVTGATDAQIVTFLDQALPWLDSNTAIGRYAYFMVSDGILVSGNSISSGIGAAYVSTSS